MKELKEYKKLITHDQSGKMRENFFFLENLHNKIISRDFAHIYMTNFNLTIRHLICVFHFYFPSKIV